MSDDRPPRGPAKYERQVTRLAILTGLPGVLLSLTLLWFSGATARTLWTVGILLGGSWLMTTMMLRERVIRPLQTLSNMLAALREGDYSIRARGAVRDDALGLALLESNLLGETLRAQRLGAMEATALLRTVMSEIDVAVFAFDERESLRLVNRAGERLLAQSAERLLGRTASQLGVEEFLEGESPRTTDASFPGAAGRWEVRRGQFRQDGLPHMLLVVADVSKTLREQELVAWQRIVRVLSHEINNSLAPIKSLAGTMRSLVDGPRTPDVDADLRKGLDVIGGRSEALGRFMSAYARLAKLPAPNKRPVDVGAWVRRVGSLETRLPVSLEAGPQVTVQADGDQLDQLLINVLRNAVDASLSTSGRVRVTWAARDGWLTVSVIDEGPGLPESANVFVPFFTTKPEGSGIGLVLSRQIAEAHGGRLTLENRANGRGCIATIQLPLTT